MNSTNCKEGSTLSLYQRRFTNSPIVVEKRKRCTRPALRFEGEIRQVLSNLVGNASTLCTGAEAVFCCAAALDINGQAAEPV